MTVETQVEVVKVVDRFFFFSFCHWSIWFCGCSCLSRDTQNSLVPVTPPAHLTGPQGAPKPTEISSPSSVPWVFIEGFLSLGLAQNTSPLVSVSLQMEIVLRSLDDQSSS